MKNHINVPPSSSGLIPWKKAMGPVKIPMTNDYLFRALLQENNYVLKGLICSLLHLAPSDIDSVVITNPVELGRAPDDKAFLLDIKIFLNGQTYINLEMQVINEYNWKERSLSYLCRNFDQLKSGEFYGSARPVIQIGLLDFTLFPEAPEFYATYQLLNVKKYTLYSDKLRLSVLDLTRIDLADEKDKLYQTDYWAMLFKAATWEEIKMLAQNNEYINEAASTVYQLTQEEKIRYECEAREDYYRRQRGIQMKLEALERSEKALERSEKTLEIQRAAIEDMSAAIESHVATIKDQNDAIKNLTSENEKLLAWARAHGYEQ